MSLGRFLYHAIVGLWLTFLCAPAVVLLSSNTPWKAALTDWGIARFGEWGWIACDAPELVWLLVAPTLAVNVPFQLLRRHYGTGASK